MLYGIERWAMKKQHKNKIRTSKIGKVCYMCGKFRWDKIKRDKLEWDGKNERGIYIYIEKEREGEWERERVGAAYIVETMEENRLNM